MSQKKQMPNYMKFVLGGTAGMMGTCVVQPMDVVKTRMQMSGVAGSERECNNSVHCVKVILQKQGIRGLYKGIGAGLIRQATYTTTRLGIYQYLNDYYRAKYDAAPNVKASIMFGLIAGACGAFVGNPAEVALIRTAADGRLPPSERRNYKNVVDAFIRIVREEGAITLLRGCVPTVERAIVINIAQLASYSQFKNLFRTKFDIKDGFMLHLYASTMSGALTTLVSMPLDIAKTRIQTMKVIDGKPEYTGMLDVMAKISKHEGVLALWKGITPYFFRLTPHTILIFVFLEQLNKMYNKYVLGIDKGSSM